MGFHRNSLHLSLLTAVLLELKCTSRFTRLSILTIAHSTGMLRSLQSQQLREDILGAGLRPCRALPKIKL